mmetsp:Transcript_20660/g.41701  ORF Transcript_20660/g.41701 Transcript_20660/m.41701 type:complete len:239 (-) Transcript_20660:649-1365(-)
MKAASLLNGLTDMCTCVQSPEMLQDRAAIWILRIFFIPYHRFAGSPICPLFHVIARRASLPRLQQMKDKRRPDSSPSEVARHVCHPIELYPYSSRQNPLELFPCLSILLVDCGFNSHLDIVGETFGSRYLWRPWRQGMPLHGWRAPPVDFPELAIRQLNGRVFHHHLLDLKDVEVGCHADMPPSDKLSVLVLFLGAFYTTANTPGFEKVGRRNRHLPRCQLRVQIFFFGLLLVCSFLG